MRQRRTINVDEETYQVLRETAEKLKIGISGVVRMMVLNDIPLSSLAQIVQRETPAGKTQTIEDTPSAFVRQEVGSEPMTREVTQEKTTKKEMKEKEDDRRATRPVGKDHKKFFAEKFGIPYYPDED